MIIDLVKLNSGLVDKVNFKEIYSFSEEDISKTELLALNDVNINGYINKNSLDNYCLNAYVNGVMILPCSITLKPVECPFSIEIEGNIQEMLDEINKNTRKVENTIDILPIIWENILMEIPMKVVSDESKNLKLEGKGWRLITEQEESSKSNSELEKLKDLL